MITAFTIVSMILCILCKLVLGFIEAASISILAAFKSY